MSPGIASAQGLQPLRKRHVFYFSGFDPRGARHYHRLYRDEAAKQAGLGGLALTIGPRTRASEVSSAWEIRTSPASGEVLTQYEFMNWDDIIRRHWPQGELRLAYEVTWSMGYYLFSGTWWRAFKVAWPPAFASLYPLLLINALLVLIAAAAVGAGWAAASALHLWVAPFAALAAAAAVLALGRALETKLNSYWLARINAFSVRQSLGRVPDLEQRIDAFAARIAQALQEDKDCEALIVSHSVGTSIAVSALARALLQMPADRAISFLTLGQCIPALSLLPRATAFRSELARLAAASNVYWIDFTAPTDGACFAMTDPVRATGLREGKGPKLLSARFPTLFEPARYARIRRNRFRNHFQYLMAGDKLGVYDYFALTAGPSRLIERYAHERGAKPGRFSLFQ